MIDKTSYRLLKTINKEHRISYQRANGITKQVNDKLPNDYVSALKSYDFIKIITTGTIPDGEGGYYDAPLQIEITLKGIAYIQERRRSGVQFWVPYLITTLIALLSLVGTIADNWCVIQSWFSA